MKINSINSFINNKSLSFGISAVPYPEFQRKNAPTFSRSAVPYPEYQNYSYSKETNKGIIEELTAKITSLFHPEVQKQAAEIKADIDNLYDKKAKSDEAVAARQLLSVLA